MLAFDWKRISREIRKEKAKTILVQLPEGLRLRAAEIVERIEKISGARVFLSLEKCFGACDLALRDAEAVKAELIVHFGHSKIFSPKIRALFYPLEFKAKAKGLPLLAGELERNGIKRVALSSTIQFIPMLKEAAVFLKEHGFTVLVGRGDSRVRERGQVLGCDYSSVKAVEGRVDGIVFVGDGLFHPQGIAAESSKMVFAFNPLNSEIKSFEGFRERLERQRMVRIAVAGEAKSFGILLSSKAGQLQLGKALKAKRIVEAAGRKAFLLVAGELKAEQLLGMKVEALVNTACPRIAVDDFKSFKQPMLSFEELRDCLKG